MQRHSLLAITLITLTLAGPASAQKKDSRQRDYEAERRTLENMYREIRAMEADIKTLTNSIEDRKKQIAEAPKTIDPAVAEMNELTKRQEAAKDAILGVRKKLDESDAKVIGVMKSLRSEYAGADQLDAQEKKLEEARAATAEQRAKIVATLKGNPDHRRLTEHTKLARSRVEQTKIRVEDGKAGSSELVEASTDLLRLETELNLLEASVLEKEEAYKKAVAAQAEALSTLNYLREMMAEKLKTNPQYQAAAADAAAAKEKFTAATKEVQEASKAKFEAVAKVNKLKSQLRSFESETTSMVSRKTQLEGQLRNKEARARDYARQIGR